MLFRYFFMQTGLNPFHSPDLADMRRALLDDDQDGPDGGSADIAPRTAASAGKARHRMTHRATGHAIGPRNRPRPQQPSGQPGRRSATVRGQGG